MPARKSVPCAARRTRHGHMPALVLAATLLAPLAAGAAPAPGAPIAGTVVPGERAVLVRSAVVNFADLARQEALHRGERPAVRPLVHPELNESDEPGAGILGSPAPALPFAPQSIQLASPPPSASFMGLDDIPMVDSSYIIIPPDVDGAVGRTKILEGLNNNYRVLDKSTGATISTVGTATFWAPTGAVLNALTDPRTLYDPYNDRWITEMQTFVSSGDILIGVSQTSDPNGSWNLYRFNTGVSIDFPIMGFNKNWIVVGINRYSAGGSFQRGITLIVDYPQARAGTGSATLVTQTANSHFCSAPCATFSTTSDTLYVVTHLSSTGGTYEVDWITGTPSAPVYTSGGTLTRPGGGWMQPGGNILPQGAPISGASACATPCAIESQDAQIRSAPVFRSGSIWYTQTVGLPSSGITHTGVQWTRLTTPSGAFVDGGRLEDATATATNGGKWYAYPHIAVNAAGDFMVGFSQFSSAQHPGAGYAMHLGGDPAGSLRDPLIYHAGEDYYHKTFTSTTGRNRWGDFSTAQVDPDDATLWTVQEYAKARVGTDDGNTGSNSSRWSTWWAAVGSALPTATIAPGPSLNEGNSGVTPFDFTVNLSAASSQPVTVDYQTSDGTATALDNDYVPATSSIVIPAGNLSGTIAVSVIGDTLCEPSETFDVTLTGATNAVVGAANTSTGTILDDDVKTIMASAGAGGSISPSGAVVVSCFASQGFAIAASGGFHVADVLVDGVSVGPVTTYTFNTVTAPHAIAVSFAANLYTLALTSLGTGSIAKSPDQASYASGTPVQLTATGGTGFAFTGWSGDAGGNANPLGITMDSNKSIAASFADIAPPNVAVLVPNGGESVTEGNHTTLQWLAVDNRVVARVDLRLSRDGAGGPYDSLAYDVSNSGSYDWVATGPGTTQAFLQVSARDSAGNSALDASDAAFTIVGTTGVEDGPVTTLELAPIVPNPLRGAGVVAFALPQRTRVHLSLIDVQGREAAVLAEGEYPAGRYRMSWRGSQAVTESGLYFVRLSAGGRTFVRRAVLLR